MPDDMKLDPKALEAAYRAWPEVADRKDDRADFEFAISAYLSALPSLPSDIDGLVEEMEAVTAAVLYTCADCEEGGNYEGMCHAADNCVLLDGRVLCEDCYSDGHYPKGAPRIPDIKKSLDRLIAALRARQAPAGVVEGVRVDVAERIAAMMEPPLTERERTIVNVAVGYALSAMPSGAVKVKQLSWEDWPADGSVLREGLNDKRRFLERTETPWETYVFLMLREDDETYWLDGIADLEEQSFSAPELAREAADSFVAARILSALEGQPS